MSTYTTTATLGALYGLEVNVNRNLLEATDGDMVRVDLEDTRDGHREDLSAYLTLEDAVALAFAILDAAGAQPVGRYCEHTDRGTHPGDTASTWTSKGLTFPSGAAERAVCPSSRPVYAAPKETP